MADFRISLGVDVQVGDIQGQLNNIKPDPIKLNIDMNHINGQIGQIKSQIKSLNNLKINLGTTNSGGDNVKSSVNDMNLAYKQMLDIQKKANSLSLKMNSLDASKNVNELKELSSQFARLKSDYEVLKSTFGNQLTPIQLGNLQAELDETTAKLAAMDAKFADTKANFASNIKSNFGTFKQDISKISSEFDKLSNKPSELEISIKQLRQAFTGMKNASKTGNIDKIISSYEQYKTILKDINSQLNINARAEQNSLNADLLNNKKAGLLAETNKWLKDNSRAAKQFEGEIRRIQTALASCTTDADFKRLTSDFGLAKKQAKELGLTGQTLGDKLKEQFSKYSQYLSVASVIMYVTQGLKDMFQQVVAIDTAMTELKKVTNETDASYDNFLSNAANRAKEIGTTIDGLVASTADFARLGYNFEQSAGLAEVANIYAVVGDEIDGVEGATQSLVSTMAAFKDEMNDMSDSEFALSIVDKFNEVSNNFSISSGGIGEALQRSASSLATANSTLDESIALITAANTVVQDPEKVGNAMKTISMRIRGAKTELEEAGESTDGMVESTAKLREEIMALSGVDIMLNEDTFKSPYAIMDELSQKWKDISDIAQASIIELIAGKAFARMCRNVHKEYI